MTNSSLIQMFGYTAMMKAAISPARRPEISRPARPPTTMAAAPMMQHQIRWAKYDLSPTAEAAARANTNPGGNDAVGTTRWAP